MYRKLFFNKIAGFQLTKACNFIKKETPVQVFSCEFCKTFNVTFFAKYLRTTASVFCKLEQHINKVISTKKNIFNENDHLITIIIYLANKSPKNTNPLEFFFQHYCFLQKQLARIIYMCLALQSFSNICCLTKIYLFIEISCL